MAAIALALVVAWATWQFAGPTGHPSDFQYWWRGTRLWWAGVDPYAMRPRGPYWHLWPLWDRLFYPLPALLITAPFALLGMQAGHTAFIAFAAGLVAWRLTRDAWWPLLLFLTPSFLVAALVGQWSPWMVLGAIVPSAGFLLAAKPTLGLACWLYRPTWRAVWSALAIVALSLVLMPSWPLKWLDNLQAVVKHPPPILTPGGVLVLLAALRWRDPSARFLLAMVCVPQLGIWSDQLPLFLVCRTRREALLYTLGSGVSFACWLAAPFGAEGNTEILSAPYVILGCYWTALYLVLRRPNEGAVPAWLEHAVKYWPPALRGTARV